MPGWHAALEKQGLGETLKTVGILQEQHPDRALLFMQWKGMDWPLMVDSLNLLEVSYVPITLFLDESGIIQAINPEIDEVVALMQQAPALEDHPGATGSAGGKMMTPSAPRLRPLRDEARQGGAAERLEYADALVLWGGTRRLDQAIEAYGMVLDSAPDDAIAHFHRGVAHRRRFDSARRRPDDFERAVAGWSRALELDPNNYIWRRRIQQYGPRLDKPYSFYDWVRTAREEIHARGERPSPLSVEPGGAEFAYPIESFGRSGRDEKEPDPGGRIHRDPGGFIHVHAVVVPPRIGPGDSARVHVTFTPNADEKAHWNNEVDDLILWLDLPPGWEADARRLTTPNPRSAVSQEVRKVEFEIRIPPGSGPGLARIPAYALYYVCEDVRGTCLYRRQDVTLPIQVAPDGAG